MQELNEGGVVPASNPTEGAPVQEPSNQQVQAQVPQSQEPSNLQGGGNQNDWAAQIRGQQAVTDRMQAQLMQMQQQQMAFQPQQQFNQPLQQNPYDPNTHGQDYWRWEMRQMSQDVAKQTRQELLGVIEQASTRQQEIQWQTQHPNIDINHVKAWGQANGVVNLDHAYTLMTLPNTMQNVQQATFNQTFNQARQPITSATPLNRGQATNSPIQPKVSFADTLKQWEANPNIEDTWSAEFKADFDRELNIRNSQIRNNG
jgi:hypothetical protein